MVLIVVYLNVFIFVIVIKCLCLYVTLRPSSADGFFSFVFGSIGRLHEGIQRHKGASMRFFLRLILRVFWRKKTQQFNRQIRPSIGCFWKSLRLSWRKQQNASLLATLVDAFGLEGMVQSTASKFLHFKRGKWSNILLSEYVCRAYFEKQIFKVERFFSWWSDLYECNIYTHCFVDRINFKTGSFVLPKNSLRVLESSIYLSFT